MRDGRLRALDAGLTVRAAPGVVLHRDGGEPGPGGLQAENKPVKRLDGRDAAWWAWRQKTV